MASRLPGNVRLRREGRRSRPLEGCQALYMPKTVHSSSSSSSSLSSHSAGTGVWRAAFYHPLLIFQVDHAKQTCHHIERSASRPLTRTCTLKEIKITPRAGDGLTSGAQWRRRCSLRRRRQGWCCSAAPQAAPVLPLWQPGRPARVAPRASSSSRRDNLTTTQKPPRHVRRQPSCAHGRHQGEQLA